MVENESVGKKDYHMHWRQFVAACLLVGGGQGLITNCLANYITPIMSVTGQGQAIVGGAISVGTLCMMVLLAFVGKILKKAKFKPLLIICAIIGLGAFIAMGTVKSIAGYYILFPVMELGMAIPVYVTGPMLVTNWFEKKKGLLTGIMMLVGSVAAVIGSLAAGALLGGEPYNMMRAFGTMGIISLVLVIIGASMAVISPAAVGLKPYGAEETSGNAEAAQMTDAQTSEVPGITSAKALKSAAFVSIFIIVFLIICCASFSTLLSNFANVNYGYSNAQGSIIMSLFTAGSAVGGLLWGILDDHLGVVSTTVIALICVIIAIAGLAFLGGTAFSVLLAFACLFGFGCASGGVQQPMLVAKFFGQRDYGAIFSKIQMAQSLGALLSVVAIGAVAQATGSYVPALIAMIVLMVIAILLLFVAKKSSRKLWVESGQEPPKV